MKKKLSKKQFIVRGILVALAIVLLGVAIYAGVAFYKVNKTLEEVTKNPEEVRVEMVVVVLAEENVEEIGDLSELLIAYQDKDKEHAREIMEQINASIGEGVSYREFSDSLDMVDALYSKTIKAMIINKAYLDVIAETEGYEDFSERTKVIFTQEVLDYINLVEEKERNLKQFVVYISGIDTWGHVSRNSRSDVNILAVVNTETKQVQLINTPRDYFVDLPNSGGVKDKLTHAGLYGVDNSIGTLEMIYDIEIDYFVRMNFSGFEAIIDALGGVDVYSEYDFTVEPIKHYVKGMNHLTGLEALAFARERHSFSAGDHQRGHNQMAVITAVLNKMMSPEILYKYADVLEALGDTFQTNMTPDEIYELVKMELVAPGEWVIDTYAVRGSGTKSTTFTMPRTTTYVMIPNEEDIEVAKQKIDAVLGEE